MSDTEGTTRSGGVNISGGIVSTNGGDITGRDKNISQASRDEIAGILNPVKVAVDSAPEGNRQSAVAKLEALKSELGKGKENDDGHTAKLIDGFLALAPNAASSIVSAFASPVLGTIAGPVTKYVIDRLKGDSEEENTIDV